MSYHSLVASTILALGLFPTPVDKVKLQFKHKEESSSTVKSTSKTHQILKIAGMDIETQSTSTVTLTSTVGKRGADGRLPIQQRIDALAVQLSLPMGVSIEFDSSNPTAQSDNPMLQAQLDTYKARVGSMHTIVLGKNNEVIAVEGVEKILEKATPAAVEVLRAELKPEHVKKAAEQAYAVLPTEPVGKGDTWTRTSTARIGGGQTLTFDMKFEYLGTVTKDGHELDHIGTTALTVGYSMDPDAASPLKVTQSNLKIDMSKGSILFDRARGQVVESNSLTRITGDMTLSINGMDFPSSLDLTFDSASAMQR